MSRGGDRGRDEGWVKAFIVEEERAEEFAKLYKSLGYEVRVEPVSERDLGDECKQCYTYLCSRCRVIYIRRVKTYNSSGDNLDIDDL
jgi:hypothetical protein